MGTTKYNAKRTIPFQFGDKHKEYIRQCSVSTYNIAEGAVRAGKTIDNVYAFAHELKTTPDKIHLATGSTAANAKLNIGDANGFGLEYIFRGQCRWGKYKGNECLNICGPATHFKQKIVIFAGAALCSSFKKIRGNSYGMWIATEINLHHENTIKEAFNRQLAAKRRKIFWDLNPDNPNAFIYVDYIDKYRDSADNGKLIGGYNYQHFTIFDNTTITDLRKQEIISQYDISTVWYKRDILGQRCVAEGLIYAALANDYAENDITKKKYYLTPQQFSEKYKDRLVEVNIGVDYGGNVSGHAFVAAGITRNYNELIAIKSHRIIKDIEKIDPEQLDALIIEFVNAVLEITGFISCIYPDNNEQVLIRGLKRSLIKAGLGHIPVKNSSKIAINNRIFAVTSLTALNKFYYTDGCESLIAALSTAVWDEKKIEKIRLDDGSTDIDSLDAFEYSFERRIKRLLPKSVTHLERSETNVG